jgi:hypothetical protein
MPHDHPHRGHDHAHGHGLGHGREDGTGLRRNHAAADHLHSHPHAEAAAEDLQTLTAQFIDGFVTAKDKTAFLRLAGVPFERPGQAGTTGLKLVDVELRTEWQVGTASPAFGSRELSYLPFPGAMVAERTNMALVYVSLEEKSVWDIREFLRSRQGE